MIDFRNVDQWNIGNNEIKKAWLNNTLVWEKPDIISPFYVENITNSNETISIEATVNPSSTITVEYSTDTLSWSTLGDISTTPITYTLTPGSILYLRASTNTWKNYEINGMSKVGGNIMSLLYGSNFTGQEVSFPSSVSQIFIGLFAGDAHLQSASHLVLPVTTLTNSCYKAMFGSCTSLVDAPALPATTLVESCYQNMFNGCTSLVDAPALPATTLAEWCYSGMFLGCTSLVTAYDLHGNRVYQDSCTIIFKGCTSFVNAPALPATTLASYCYTGMFEGCTSLVNAPALPAGNLMAYCYIYMFKDCINLVGTPELLAQTLVNGCYNYMFQGCSKVDYIKCTARYIDMGNVDHTKSWVSGVSSTGTFVKAGSTVDFDWHTGVDGIPSDWTVQDAA